MSRRSNHRAIQGRHRQGVDSRSRATRAPDRRLAPFFRREHVGVSHGVLEFSSWLEPPQPAVTLMISLEDPLTTDRATLPQAWIAGLDDRPDIVETSGRHTELDLKLTPIGAHVLCGIPMSELRGQVVPLDQVFGVEAGSLAEQLVDLPDWDARFDRVERLLLGRLEGGVHPDPFVVEAVRRLEASDGLLKIGELAADLRVSRRHLASRFGEQVGLPPKTFARLLRFEAVRRLMAEQPSTWAEVAARCGYSDQSHLNREFRELSGTTPADFLARQVPEGPTIGDGITFVQDGTGELN